MSGEQRGPVRKRLRLSEYDYTAAGYYFVTVCTRVRKRNILSRISVGDGLRAVPPFPVLTPIGEAVDAAIRKIPGLYPGVGIDIYCIMPDHLHLIVTLPGRPGGRPLQDIIGRMKSFTQREYRRLCPQSDSLLWQTSYFDHIIRTDRELDETRAYIQNNPMRRMKEEDL